MIDFSKPWDMCVLHLLHSDGYRDTLTMKRVVAKGFADAHSDNDTFQITKIDYWD